jgi:hypothetical protein
VLGSAYFRKEPVLSTLTKILIVLLTLSSIFLCGIVVTYVANADNFKVKYTGLMREKDALKESEANAKKQLNEGLAKAQQAEDKLNADIAAMKAKTEELTNNLANAEREKATLLEKVNSWTSITEGFYKTNDQQRQLLDNTLAELNKLQSEQIKTRKELGETTSYLQEKMAIIDTLQAEKKRLVEEKTELQARLDRMLVPGGKVTAAATPVTPEKTTVQQAADVEKINLKGLISSVDMKNSMAGISIGSADGVKEGMKFHVSRGDQFVCNLLIVDVKTDQAVGVLELVQQPPKVGDNATTNL